jgi:hypothetical protein
VDFFANYRCRLHFIDLFSELPIVATEDTPTLHHQFEELLSIPAGTEFDICLFWDLFNFLDRKTTEAFLSVLRPHLTPDSLAHAFSVHNTSSPQCNHLYSISQLDTIRLGKRATAVPIQSVSEKGLRQYQAMRPRARASCKKRLIAFASNAVCCFSIVGWNY